MAHFYFTGLVVRQTPYHTFLDGLRIVCMAFIYYMYCIFFAVKFGWLIGTERQI